MKNETLTLEAQRDQLRLRAACLHAEAEKATGKTLNKPEFGSMGVEQEAAHLKTYCESLTAMLPRAQSKEKPSVTDLVLKARGANSLEELRQVCANDTNRTARLSGAA
jgi:hypothetical protein